MLQIILIIKTWHAKPRETAVLYNQLAIQLRKKEASVTHWNSVINNKMDDFQDDSRFMRKQEYF